MLGLNWAFLLQLGACSSSFSVLFLLHASTAFMAVGRASQDLPYFSVPSLLLAPGDISAAAHHLDLALPALFLYPLCSGSQPPSLLPVPSRAVPAEAASSLPSFLRPGGKTPGAQGGPSPPPPPRDTATEQNAAPRSEGHSVSVDLVTCELEMGGRGWETRLEVPPGWALFKI